MPQQNSNPRQATHRMTRNASPNETPDLERHAIAPARLEATITSLKARGHEHLAAVYEAMRGGRVELLMIAPGMAAFTPPKRRRGRGLIVMVGDDLARAEGPAGFPLRALRKLAARAGAWAVMVGAPVAEGYRWSANYARRGETSIIVETQESEERAWVDFMTRHAGDCAMTLVMSPVTGVVEGVPRTS